MPETRSGSAHCRSSIVRPLQLVSGALSALRSLDLLTEQSISRGEHKAGVALVRAAVIIFPGSNRERDVCAALTRASGRAPMRIWHGEAELPECDLIVLPGGFAYGDYLRCGAI